MGQAKPLKENTANYENNHKIFMRYLHNNWILNVSPSIVYI